MAGGNDNLIPVRSEEEAREKGAKGGKKSGQTRKQQKTFREVFKAILRTPYKPTDSDSDVAKRVYNDNPGITFQQAMALAVAYRAANGDIYAFTTIRDSIGEKPVDKAEVANTHDVSPNLEKLIANVSKRLGNGRES